MPPVPSVSSVASALAAARSADISIEAAADVNPDARDRASPVVVRLFELGNQVNFLASDFLTLYDKESQALNTDLIARDEYQLRPGQTSRVTRQLNPNTRVVGVIAAFRDLERSSWRATLDLPTRPGRVNLVVSLAGRTVRIEAKPL
jgi:type VI secretion system protein VasD